MNRVRAAAQDSGHPEHLGSGIRRMMLKAARADGLVQRKEQEKESEKW